MEIFAKSSTHMMNIARMMDYPWDIDSPPAEPRALHNMYARALGCTYARKFGEMCKAVSESLRSQQFLLYALAARSLIETTATLRYYIRHEYRPLLGRVEMSQQEMKQLLDADDRHLRGGRFDWQAFISGRYGEMVEEARRELVHKKGSKNKKYLPPNLMNEQRNVYTCIEKWATEEPGALLTYNLFCELVPPNAGSNFLVASTEGGKMHFGSGRGVDGSSNSRPKRPVPWLSCHQGVWRSLALARFERMDRRRTGPGQARRGGWIGRERRSVRS